MASTNQEDFAERVADMLNSFLFRIIETEEG